MQFNWYWPTKVEWWRTKYDKTNIQLLFCQTNTEELTSKIELTNSQIQQWSVISAEQQASFNQIKQELESLSTQTNSQITTILAEPIHSDCNASMQFLNQSINTTLKW